MENIYNGSEEIMLLSELFEFVGDEQEDIERFKELNLA